MQPECHQWSGGVNRCILCEKMDQRQRRRAVVWYGASYLSQALFFALLAQTNTFLIGVWMLYLMRVRSGIIILLDTYLLLTHTKEEVLGRVFSQRVGHQRGCQQVQHHEIFENDSTVVPAGRRAVPLSAD